MHGNKYEKPGSMSHRAGLCRGVELRTTIFIQQFPDIGGGGTHALLDPAHKFVFLTFHVSQIVIGKLTVGLLELAFDDIPIPLEVEFCFVHRFLSLEFLKGEAFASELFSAAGGDQQTSSDSRTKGAEGMCGDEILGRVKNILGCALGIFKTVSGFGFDFLQTVVGLFFDIAHDLVRIATEIIEMFFKFGTRGS